MALTNRKPGYTATVKTSYRYFQGACMSMYVAFLGVGKTNLEISMVTQEGHSKTIKSLTGSNTWNRTQTWTRIFERLADGVYQVKIRGQRDLKMGSGVTIDDLDIMPCDHFCKCTQKIILQSF